MPTSAIAIVPSRKGADDSADRDLVRSLDATDDRDDRDQRLGHRGADGGQDGADRTDTEGELVSQPLDRVGEKEGAGQDHRERGQQQHDVH
jgi:hypothetical protein